jgi:murein L,D-transpeptidase YafK
MALFSLARAASALRLLLVLAAVAAQAQAPKESPRQRPGLEDEVKALCQRMGAAWPPVDLFFRAFKHEAVLEVWAGGKGGDRYVLLNTYPVLATSGGPGPKRREGDKQVPEGFYRVEYLNPASRFHLSLKLDYPNASDLVRSDPEHPGFDIFIHGGGCSIGCLPIGDPGVEEVFLLATKVSEAGRPIPVHVFPARMAGEEWRAFWSKETAGKPDLAAFWEELQPGYDAFESSGRPPEIEVEPGGRYRVK